MAKNSDDPRAPYKLYDGDKLIGTTRHAPKHDGSNSNSKAKSVQSSISSLSRTERGASSYNVTTPRRRGA
jgi:hypothetical protein